MTPGGVNSPNGSIGPGTNVPQPQFAVYSPLCPRLAVTRQSVEWVEVG